MRTNLSMTGCIGDGAIVNRVERSMRCVEMFLAAQPPVATPDKRLLHPQFILAFAS